MGPLRTVTWSDDGTSDGTMTAATYPTGTVTFLFTDIEGSTRLWEAEPEAMHVALGAHDEIVRAAIEVHGGVVFKTVGDAFCAAFARPEEALLAAVGAQRTLSGHSWPEAIGRLRVRAGIHTGSAVESGGDYFGPTVNRVARLMSLGAGEQILVSSTSASLLRDVLPADTGLRDLGAHRLKDLSQPENTFQVIAPSLRDISRPGYARRASPAAAADFGLRRTRYPNCATFAGPHPTPAGDDRPTPVGGKTRLALEVTGATLGEDYRDGGWFVQLSQLRSAELIAQATADVLRIRKQPQDSVAEAVTPHRRPLHAARLRQRRACHRRDCGIRQAAAEPLHRPQGPGYQPRTLAPYRGTWCESPSLRMRGCSSSTAPKVAQTCAWTRPTRR